MTLQSWWRLQRNLRSSSLTRTLRTMSRSQKVIAAFANDHLHKSSCHLTAAGLNQLLPCVLLQ